MILRFSAMGDVVLLVPVVRALVATYPDIEVTVVTRPKFASFFTDIERVVPFPADVDYTYTGIFGMRDLFRKLLRKGSYTAVIDMHDHIRTIILRSLFKLFGTPVIVFNKGRNEKHRFTQKENKDTTPLMHTVERYQEVAARAGFPVNMQPAPYFAVKTSTEEEVTTWLQQQDVTKKGHWIGIAPFAMHISKLWPLENYPKLIALLKQDPDVRIFLFGGGEKEVKYFEGLRQQFPEQCIVVAGHLKLKQELALMQQLDLMLCVDSSNMHLASLMDVPLLSIWGGTHPDVGFGPWGKGAESILQISREELPCRPCSVYGRETCYRGDFACQTRITPDAVYTRIQQALSR